MALVDEEPPGKGWIVVEHELHSAIGKLVPPGRRVNGDRLSHSISHLHTVTFNRTENTLR
jgi:hypothetical protein